MSRNDLINKAMETWAILAISDNATMETDYKVNHLLEQIAGKDYVTDSDDPIYDTMKNLTNGKLRAFINQAAGL